ncbi:MAG: hypothetical protein AB7U85_00195 [Alphaproteobacteria bacterium]
MSDIIVKAQNIVMETASWRDARKKLKDEKIELSANQLLDVLDYWQKHIVAKFTDNELVSELDFWANDGSFEKHLNGFDAPPPKVLAYEAKNRGWTVLTATSGSYIINPPERTPIVIKEK